MFTKYNYRVQAYYWGTDAQSVEDLVCLTVNVEYDDCEWSFESREWSWFVETLAQADSICSQLNLIRGLTVDLLRFDATASVLH